MQLYKMLGVVGFGLLTLVAVPVLAGSTHVAEALSHAQAALAQGEQGYSEALVEHAKEALKHAELAKKETKSPHLEQAIRGLNGGITEADDGYLAEARAEIGGVIEDLSKVE